MGVIFEISETLDQFVLAGSQNSRRIGFEETRKSQKTLVQDWNPHKTKTNGNVEKVFYLINSNAMTDNLLKFYGFRHKNLKPMAGKI
jgi:hypothetical protein